MKDVFFIESRDIPARPLNCPPILFLLFLTYLFLSKILEHLIIWRGPHPLDSNYFLSACLFLFLTSWLLNRLTFFKNKNHRFAFSSTNPGTLPVVGIGFAGGKIWMGSWRSTRKHGKFMPSSSSTCGISRNGRLVG